MSTLIFLATILFIIYSLISVGYLLLKKKYHRATFKLVWLVLWISIYATLLLGISLQSKVYPLALNEDHCFDDWCIAVNDISKKPIGETEVIYLVSLKVSNKAKRVSQKPDHPHIYLVNNFGKYQEDQPAKLEFEKVAGKQIPIDSMIKPQSSFITQMVFKTSNNSFGNYLVIDEGSFPVQLMIGDQESYLHKDTIFKLE